MYRIATPEYTQKILTKKKRKTTEVHNIAEIKKLGSEYIEVNKFQSNIILQAIVIVMTLFFYHRQASYCRQTSGMLTKQHSGSTMHVLNVIPTFKQAKTISDAQLATEGFPILKRSLLLNLQNFEIINSMKSSIKELKTNSSTGFKSISLPQTEQDQLKFSWRTEKFVFWLGREKTKFTTR